MTFYVGVGSAVGPGGSLGTADGILSSAATPVRLSTIGDGSSNTIM
jgi:hypothetical protein